MASRLIVFFSPSGTIHHQRRPTGSGTSFAFPAGSILEPLEPIRDHLVLIDGLDFHLATNHGRAWARCSPATVARVTQVEAPPSINMSRRSSRQAHASRPSSWVSRRALGSASMQTRISYGPGGVYVTPDDNPHGVYERLFGELTSDAWGNCGFEADVPRPST